MIAFPVLTLLNKSTRASVKVSRLVGEYIVSDAKARVLMSRVTGMRDKNCSAGFQDPDIKVIWISRSCRAETKDDMREGVISRSPDGEAWSGFGLRALNPASDEFGNDLTHVKSRFGTVARRSTEALKSVKVK